MLPWSRKSAKLSSAVAKAQASAKGNIISALNEAVSELQYQYRNTDEPIPSNETTARLCIALEAVFVHGLKETFLGRLTSRLAGQEASIASPRMPEPSFWTFALVFSHKQVISQVDCLSQVTSDVGKARAWLRIAFNDGLIISYLAAMIADTVSLNVHYENFAILRDPDKRDLCLSYLNGVSVYNFNLSVNVSTLNRWQPRPLVLAGCWRQSSVDVDIGSDVAADLEDEVLPTPEFVRTLAEPIRDSAETSGYIRRGLINEEEALRLILQSSPVAFSPDFSLFKGASTPDKLSFKGETKVSKPPTLNEEAREKSIFEFDDKPDASEKYHLLPPKDDLQSTSSPSPEPMLSRSRTVSPTLEWDHPNTVDDPSLYSTSLADELSRAEITYDGDNVIDFQQSPPSVSRSLEDKSEKNPLSIPETPLPATPSLQPSPVPSDLSISSCQCSSAGPQPDCRVCSTLSPAPRPQLVLSEPYIGRSQGTDLISAQNTRKKRLQGLGFSDTPSIRVPSLSLTQTISLTAALDQVSHEEGLDSQDWQCDECNKSIGAIFGPGRLCEYTKKYFCEECHTNIQTSVIPARLLYNWDGAHYKVSKSSMIFLQAISTKPIFDIRSFSPSLPKFAPCLDTSYRLRKQLTYLSAYLTACSKANQEGVKVNLAEAVWPREYLYTGTDLYSLRDMEQLFTGELITTLTKAVTICMNHVSCCLVCSGRGFICELCKDKRPVYPFNLDSTSQCSECLTVIHSSCAAGLLNCPKCERLEARSLKWHVTNSKLMREAGLGDT